jgi:hypothetical protein
VKVDYSRFSWGGLHGKHVVANGKGKTGTIPAFAVGSATWEECSGNWEWKNGKTAWEACSGNWEWKNGNHPSICCREGYMGSM